MTQKITVTMRNKYQEMIERRYAVLELAAERATAPLREKIASEVKKDWGIYEMEAQYTALKGKLYELARQIEELTGKDPNGYGHVVGEYGKKSKLAQEVTVRLKDIDGVSFRIASEKQNILDKLWLADAPEAIVNMINAFDDTMKPMIEEVKALELKVIGMGLALPPTDEIETVE